MSTINSKNAERHILLATTDLKERGVVVPATVAKEAVAMAEQEMKCKAVEAFAAVCKSNLGNDCERCAHGIPSDYCKVLEKFTEKLNQQ